MPGWKWSNPPNTNFRLNRDKARGLLTWIPAIGNVGPTVFSRALSKRTGAVTGATYATDPKRGRVFRFAGGTNGINLGRVSILDDVIDNWSVSAWVRRGATGVRHEIVSNESDIGNDVGWVLSIIEDDTIEFGVFIGGYSYQSIHSIATITSTVTWYHLVGVRTPANFYIYINGVLDNSAAASGTPLASNQSLYIGRSPFAGRSFNGDISEVAVRNITLSAQAVWSEFNNPWEKYEPIIPQWVVAWAAAGGTAYNQSISGGITPAATLLNQTQKVLAGSVTPTASLISQVQKVLVGALTPTGALLNQAQKVLSGNIVPGGSLLNQAQKVLAGSITPISTLINQTQKVLSGSITPSGTLAGVKTALISLVGSLTPSGILTKEAQKVLTGSISPLGQLINQTQKILSGALTPSGVLASAKTALISLVGSLTPSGTLSKEMQKTLSGAIAPVGSVLKQIGKVLTGTLTPIGSLVASLVSSNLESTFKGMFKGMFRRMK